MCIECIESIQAGFAYLAALENSPRGTGEIDGGTQAAHQYYDEKPDSPTPLIIVIIKRNCFTTDSFN